MALGDPNDPLAQYLVPPGAELFDPEQFYAQHFGTQVPTIIPPIDAPIPTDLPLNLPKGSDDKLGGSRPAPPPPPPPDPPKPGEPYRVGPLGPDIGQEIAYQAPIAPQDVELDMPSEDVVPLPYTFDEQGQVQIGESAPGLLKAAVGAQTDARTVDQRANEYIDDPFKFREDLLARDERQRGLEAPVIADAARQQAEAANLYSDALAKANARSAKLDQDSAALASDETWFDRAGTGVQIAGYISAALAGFLNPTGPNSVVELIKSANENDVRRRQAAISAGREGVVASIEGAKAQRDAANTALLANYHVALQMIDEEMAKYDPLGAKAQNIAATRSAVLGELQGAAQAAHKAAVDEEIKVGDYYLRQRDQNRKDALARKELAKGTGGPSVVSPQLSAMLATRGINVPAGMPRKDLDAYIKLSGDIPDLAKKEADSAIKQFEARQTTSGPGGSPNAIGDQEGKAFVQADGSVFEVKDDKRREKIDNVNKAAQNIRRIADLVKILKSKYGGASEMLGTDEYQELVGLAAATDFETYVGFGLGAPSTGDKAMAEAARGGQDITSFIKDASSGFDAYAKNIEEKLTTEMRSAGYTGQPIKLKRVEGAAATERTKEQNLDVFSAPEIDAAADPEIAKRAAQRALDSVPALARQADRATLAKINGTLVERANRGIYTDADLKSPKKEIRKAFRARIKEELKPFGKSMGQDDVSRGLLIMSQASDEEIDEILAGGGGQ